MLSMLSKASSSEQLSRSRPSCSWICKYCQLPTQRSIKHEQEILQHLRVNHCVREGGSFVCRYGPNSLCSSLPVEGVNEKDYVAHVFKKHIWTEDPHVKSTLKMQVPHKDLIASRDASNRHASPSRPGNSEQKWTIYDSSQNLAAVLNDPRRSTREADFFTKTWDDSFSFKCTVPPAPHLPTVSSTYFQRYLKKTLKRNRRLRAGSHSSQVGSHAEGVFRTLTALLDKSTPDLESVPKIFLQPSFSLEEPETFNTVLPPSQLFSKTSEDSVKPSAKLLQERLSHYLDTVEVQIARQISLKSDAFFQAMTSHDALMDQLAFNIKAVSLLRKKILRIDEVLVKQSLNVLRLKQSLQNHQQVYNKLKLMATVHQAQPTIQLLLATSDFVGALDLIRTTQEIAAQELVGVHSFRHLNSQLAEMEGLIVRMMEADFIKYITADLNRPLTEDIQIIEEEHLIAIIYGMLRLGKFDFVETYRDESNTAIKAVVKQTEIEVVSQSDHKDSSEDIVNLAEQVRLLKFGPWLHLLQRVYRNLLYLLKRIKAVEGVMQDVVKLSLEIPGEITSQSTPEATASSLSSLDLKLSSSEHLRLSKSLEDMLIQVCNHSSEKCGKLLTSRAKDGSLDHIQIHEFVNLVQSTEEFCKACQEICGKPCSTLKLSLQTQAGRFARRFHEEKKNKLSLILDSEQWKQADVPVEFQELVNHISRSGQLVVPKKLSQSDENQRPQAVLHIDSQKFAVVGTVLMLLRMLVEYCQFAADVPIIGRDVATYLIEFLKFFNSRTCQLILGAGALQLVGLKTITTKNLALVLRCLQLILYYIPKVRAHFEVLLVSPKHHSVTKHFDQIIKDYKNHINEILNKFVNILDTIIESQLSKWEVKAPVPSPYFRALSKHLGKLHEAVSDILLREQLQELFRRIHISFREKLRTHLIRLKVSNDGGPQHGLVTQELTFYIENLRILQITEDENQNLEDFWPIR